MSSNYGNKKEEKRGKMLQKHDLEADLKNGKQKSKIDPDDGHLTNNDLRGFCFIIKYHFLRTNLLLFPI